MAKKEKKRIRINLSFSESEHSELLKKIGNKKPANYCKSLVMERVENMPISKQKPKTKFTKCDPNLLFEINQIGNNLNQITRLAHMTKTDNSLQLVQLIESVELVREQIKKITDYHVR